MLSCDSWPTNNGRVELESSLVQSKSLFLTFEGSLLKLSAEHYETAVNLLSKHAAEQFFQVDALQNEIVVVVDACV